MDHFGWLADELTELWEQLEAPGLKADSAEVRRILLSAIEASNQACRTRRKRAEAAGVQPSIIAELPPQSSPAAPQTRNGPGLAPEPASFALGFA